jgi:hypothetical protein
MNIQDAIRLETEQIRELSLIEPLERVVTPQHAPVTVRAATTNDTLTLVQLNSHGI